MSYQVLARKWRPSNFSQVVGQDHVVKALLNALRHERLHHAYLFTGTRGVGKTTLARILAKAINCVNLQDFNPCGQCAVCQAVDEGRFWDLIEVDAASRTKVDETRELLDNAQYAPNSGKYKVYLIDEVHMLSGHSFNALLKTLEEPPPHVKFLLATTDPQKIPVTVLSRCLQLNLKRLLPEQIFQQMQEILQQEQITFEPQALKQLARAADGSMRDGLSLLDQAIVYGAGQVKADEVNAMLGTVAQKPIESLLTALANNDAVSILAIIDDIANIHSDFSTVLEQLIHCLHRIALVQHIPGVVDQEFDSELINDLATKISVEDVQLFYQIALLGQKDLDLAPDSRMGFEMVMLRMLAFKPASFETKPNAEKASPKMTSTHVNQAAVVNKPVTEPTVTSSPVNTRQPQRSDNWADIVTVMNIESLTKELANNCILEYIDDQSCRLVLAASHKQLLSPMREKKLQQALQEYYGKPIKLLINLGEGEMQTPAAQHVQAQADRQQAAVEAIHADPTVRALQEHFDAKIVPDSIEPV